jgi:hypothetical protein
VELRLEVRIRGTGGLMLEKVEKICPPPKSLSRRDAGGMDETHQRSQHVKFASDDQKGASSDNPYA